MRRADEARYHVVVGDLSWAAACAALVAVLVGCKGRTPRTLDKPPASAPQPVQPSGRAPEAGSGEVAPATLAPASSEPIAGATFLADGTALVAHGDQLELFGVDGAPRARLAYRGKQWEVSRTASSPELAVLRNADGKNTVTFFDASGRETGSVDAGPGEAMYSHIVQLSSRRVLFKSGRDIRVLERPTGRVVASLVHFSGSVDDEVTRSVVDQGMGRIVVTELDGSGTTKTYPYRYEEIDSDGMQYAAAHTLSPDGRTLAIEEPGGVSVLALPAGARTWVKGARVLSGSGPTAGGTYARDPLTWLRPGKLTLAQGRSTLLSVEAADPKKVERFAPKAWCAGVERCRADFLVWEDVQWTSAGPVLLMADFPKLLWWAPGQAQRAFDPGLRDNAADALSADGRYVLDTDFRRAVRVLAVGPDAKTPWKIVAEHVGVGIFSPDGRRALLWSAGGFRLVELEGGRVIASGDAPSKH